MEERGKMREWQKEGLGGRRRRSEDIGDTARE